MSLAWRRERPFVASCVTAKTEEGGRKGTEGKGGKGRRVLRKCAVGRGSILRRTKERQSA